MARTRAFLTPNTLLAFDIDGTLAPIVDRPWDARVPNEVQKGLATLAAHAKVAIITGRAVEDARPMLGFTPQYLVGNHGAEGVPGMENISAQCARVCRAWLDELASGNEPWREVDGIVLEDKTYTLSFHYRHARDHRAAQRLLVGRTAGLLPVPTLLDDKSVLNLLPPGSPDKGEALTMLLAQSRSDRALYVGDDASDEAVFRMRSPAVLSVRVEPHEASAANLYLKGQKDVARLVRELVRIVAPADSSLPPDTRKGAAA
ncbi:MAG: trehalose-phosphatase [Betaproteobacteria bacterium]|nr:MAG: trehalose-phosphatase [Betaproteobacteria bacterium]